MEGERITMTVLKHEVALDNVCWYCKGCDEVDDEGWMDENGNCDVCHGTGYEMTDNGKAILNLVKRHLKGMEL